MGVPKQRMQFEGASRTTYENAVLTAALPGVDTRRSWLLVTSASHMPRALATFRAVGWNVTPYSVDYRSGTHTSWTEYSMAKSRWRWQIALHEYVGLLVYWAAGRLALESWQACQWVNKDIKTPPYTAFYVKNLCRLWFYR